jgi:hypothetical protein
MSTNIIHFIGFATPLETEKFIPAWEQYSKKEMFRKKAPQLFQQQPGSRHKFNYVSLHTWPDTEANFSFTKSDKAGYFRELPVQLVHIGGYLPLEPTNANLHQDAEYRLLVMAGHNEYDPEFYKSLPFSFRLNSYQAYYESCSYGYIFEYFAGEQEIEEIMNALKSRAGTERILCRDCLSVHA